MFVVLMYLIGHDNLYLNTTIYNHFKMLSATADSNTTYYTACQSSHRGNDSKETKRETERELLSSEKHINVWNADYADYLDYWSFL